MVIIMHIHTGVNLSGKPGNVGEFDSCRKEIQGMSAKCWGKFCHGKLFKETDAVEYFN